MAPVSMESKEVKRLPALDSLRAVAALAVLLFHYTSGYESVVGSHNTPVWDFRWGHLGVDLFFIISGYVIAWTLQRTCCVTDFAIGRIARLYPAYLAAASLTAFVIFGAGFNPAVTRSSDIAWNAVMGLPQVVNARNIDASYWTLGAELSFYVMAAAFFFGLPRIRFELFCLAWLAASLIARVLLPDCTPLQLLIVSRHSPLFVTGAMLFALSSGHRRDPLTIATFLVATGTGFIGDESQWLRPASGAVLCFFAALVFGATTGRLSFLHMRPLVVIGQASYSLYLLHQIIGYWIIWNLERQGVSAIPAIAIASISVIIAALGLRRLVEIPAQRLIRNAGGGIRRLTGAGRPERREVRSWARSDPARRERTAPAPSD